MALNSGGWRESLPFFESDLFIAVQEAGIFKDSKTFADAIALSDWQHILSEYEAQKKQVNFNLEAFVSTHFAIPDMVMNSSDSCYSSTSEYIEHMWSVLTRTPDTHNTDSLIELSRPYIVPGGRFREIYYWDSYFTALGLTDANRSEMAINMLENFLDILDEVGCIPNGNRAYYYTRSQPPVLALMFSMVEAQLTRAQRERAILGMNKEYEYWMQGQHSVSASTSASKHVVLMPNGALLNRYYDSEASPRPESYREDKEIAQLVGAKSDEFYRNIRAACESGWDFSSRWLKDENALSTIRTTEIVPVDLNALLYLLECTLARVCSEKCSEYEQAAAARKQAINCYLWSDEKGCYYDYHYISNDITDVISAAATVPLFVGMASKQQAELVAAMVQNKLLKKGGVVTTVNETSQQWDSPNGWAPLQWFAVKGLLNYGYHQQANDIMQRFTHTIETHFAANGSVLEKYNVCSPEQTAGGGEYEVQLGFGWTNGVYTRFKKLLANKRGA